jgi:hypothetical protein
MENKETICPSDVNKSKYLNSKQKKNLSKTRKLCMDYEKCAKTKCDYPDLELKNEVKKLDFNKIINTTTKCLKKKSPILCSLDEYGKISPKLKNITDRVRTCKMETCKTENEKMTKNIMDMMKKMKVNKKMSKIKKALKNKSFKKFMKKNFKKIVKKM